MAILKNTMIAASVLASYALAVPLAPMHKREMVWQTYTETAWVTQNVQATVWVDDHGKPVKTDMPWGIYPTARPATPSSTSSAAIASSPAPVVPAAPPASSAPAPVPVAPSSTASPPPTYSPAGFAVVASSSPSPAAAAAATSAPAAVTPAPAPSATVVAKGASSGGVCQGQGSGCVGDITHWDGGLGACGWNVNTASDMQIAMPYGLMGTQSNGNPYCGRSLTIQGPAGNLVQATVGDKCMGCEGDSIDLTDALFNAVAPSGDGRVQNIQWWFN